MRRGWIYYDGERNGVDRVNQSGFYFYADAYTLDFGSYSCYQNYGCGYEIDGDYGDPYRHLSLRIAYLEHLLSHPSCDEG